MEKNDFYQFKTEFNMILTCIKVHQNVYDESELQINMKHKSHQNEHQYFLILWSENLKRRWGNRWQHHNHLNIPGC